MRHSLITTSLLLTLVTGLSGCVSALVVGTAAVTASRAATDTRTLGKQLDDHSLTVRILQALRSDEHIQNSTRYRLIVYNGVVVLFGQAPSVELRNQLEAIVKEIPGVAALHNEIRQTPIIPSRIIARDSWIASKIRSQLLFSKKIRLNHVKIAVEQGEVFLYGSVTQEEAEIAIATARHTRGVKKVLQLFQHLTDNPKS